MNIKTFQYKASSGWSALPSKAMDSPNTLLILFSSSKTESLNEAFTYLKENFPNSLSIGCSSAGEIFADEIYDDSLSLAVLQFEKTKIKQAVRTINKENNSFKIGEEIARDLMADNLKSIFILSDGLNVNGSTLIKGLSSKLSHDVIVTGGLAADTDRFNETWVLSDFGLKPKQIAAIGFYGDHVSINHGSRGGWDILALEREVTRSKNNELFELDGQPALALYKKYLGDRAKDLPASGLLFPLSIKNEHEYDGITVRTIIAIDEKNQSITFAGDIPQGSKVRLMHANFDRLIDGASAAVEQALLNNENSEPQLCIAISCIGRRLVLGQRCEEEVEVVDESLAKTTQLIGFYSYGEISPLASGTCDLHNQTMTLTLIGEKNA